ncbi:amine sulfotransferase-like [Amphibalanus amphitrite]|uniref:amine sulfotransferase-like n=1 Tax=Amphibalanus amphitrite TaxID=1232801 RepID=UPI001C917E5F|nr:amine sulfotransferase-like [Amphibalanus amphitrite]
MAVISAVMAGMPVCILIRKKASAEGVELISIRRERDPLDREQAADNVGDAGAAADDFRDGFMRDALVFCPYREHVQGYLEHSDTVLCLSYEQMHQDRGSVVRKVADFLGVSLSDADVDDIVKNTSFEVMKANPYTNFHQWEDNGLLSGTEEGTFMRKGVMGDWRNYFTEEESEAFLKWRNGEVASLE